MISEPIMNISKAINVPILAAFLIGILGSTAPCQITTNLGAIGFIAKEGVDRKELLKNTIWYALGKIAVFLFYGILITLFNIELQKVSIPIFSVVRKFMGIFVILIGLYILGVINLKGSVGNTLANNSEAYIKKFPKLHPSFKMGVLFSLAFCPTLFWLFFGLVVPLSIKSTLGVIFPAFFALGTLVPLATVVLAIYFGKSKTVVDVKSVRKLQKFFKIAGGIVLVVLGVLDSFIYWFS